MKGWHEKAQEQSDYENRSNIQGNKNAFYMWFHCCKTIFAKQ